MFNLKKIRKEKKITQQILAKKIHTTQSNISGWESEKYFPDLSTTVKLCQILDCSADYLLGLSDQDYKIENKKIVEINDPMKEELINLFNQLDFGNKNQIIGYIKSYVNLQNQNKLKK